MNKQHLTLAGVREAALKAYEAGTLTAQCPNINDRACVYQRFSAGKEYNCAIGAALTEETKNNPFCEGYVSLGLRQIVEIDDQERKALQQIQDAHDAWCAASVCSSNIESIHEAEQNFLKLLKGE